MIQQYILRHRKPVPCDDILKWARFFESRFVRKVRITFLGSVRVSTVFLALDHNYAFGEPLLFETMIFDLFDKGGEEVNFTQQCSTHRAALRMHYFGVQFAKGYIRGRQG